MKREVPATPFKVVGNDGSFTTSSESPQMTSEGVEQGPPMIQDQPATSAMQACASSDLRRGSQTTGTGHSSQRGGGSHASQGIPPSLHQHNTQNIQQTTYQQQVNQIDPQQLDQLLESLVRARVENGYHHMRQAAQHEIESIRQQAGNDQLTLQAQVQSRLDELQREKQSVEFREQQNTAHARQMLEHMHREKKSIELREQQNTAQARQMIDKMHLEAEGRIQQLSQDNQKLVAELQEAQRSAENRVAHATRQAELERERAVQELRVLGAKLEAAHQKMVSSERVFSSPGSIVGSPILNNPFDHLPTPAQSVQHTEILTAGPGASVASANPLEVMFCACCGSQNVVGRPSCWRCSTMFSSFTFTANNGTDHFNAHGNQSGAPQCPPPSMSPSEAFAIQGAGAASACIANAAAGIASAAPVVGCASIAAPIGALVTEGTAGQQGAGLGGMPVSYPMGVQCGFNPNGPRIQGGHIVPTCHGVGQAVANHSRNPAPSNQGAATFSIHTPRNSSTSHGSSSSKSSTGDALIQPPQDGWLLPGETDENVYKLKHLRSIQITKLPNDATSCREWRAAFLAAVSRVPILATLISSITNSFHEVGEIHAATMVHPAVQSFRKYSLEFLGDTGAAHDIGSLRALEDQGISRDMIEPWIKTLESPVRFATGGGPQLSTEALKIYNKGLGEFNMHLLANCPMALSIGKQVCRGRTFVWQHGQKPFIALDHRRCRVWCPKENRWYADRIQHNVPIFRIDTPLKTENSATTRLSREHVPLEQPILCADETTGEPKTMFCGTCLERQTACVCRLYPEEGACHEHGVEMGALMRENVMDQHGMIPEQDSIHVKPFQEHLKKAKRKARRRENWEDAKATGQGVQINQDNNERRSMGSP